MTAATTPTDTTPAPRPGRFWADTWVITRRNLIRNVRLPQLIFIATIQPIMFLVLFTYVFGGAIGQSIPPAANGEYVNFLLPGLMVQIGLFGAIQTGVGLSEDLSQGVVSRFRSLPMARAAVLTGRTLSDAVRNAVVLVMMLVVAVLIGFRWQDGFARMALAVLVVLAFTFAFSWIFATMGLALRSPEAVQPASFILTFPLVFASSVFVPVGTMPNWLRVFADNQPVTVVATAMRGLVLGPTVLPDGRTVLTQVVLALVWCAVILAVASTMAVRVYRRATG